VKRLGCAGAIVVVEGTGEGVRTRLRPLV